MNWGAFPLKIPPHNAALEGSSPTQGGSIIYDTQLQAYDTPQGNTTFGINSGGGRETPLEDVYDNQGDREGNPSEDEEQDSREASDDEHLPKRKLRPRTRSTIHDEPTTKMATMRELFPKARITTREKPTTTIPLTKPTNEIQSITPSP